MAFSNVIELNDDYYLDAKGTQQLVAFKERGLNRDLMVDRLV